MTVNTQSDTVLRVPRSLIRPSPLNPRKHFDEEKINELGANMRKLGIIQPLTVRVRPPTEEFPHAQYELICGENRWRGSAERSHPDLPETMPAMEELPILIREVNDSDCLEIMLSENMQRKDLTELEESDAFAFALEQKMEDGTPVYANQRQFADKIGVSIGTVKNRLALQNLPKVARVALERKEISSEVAAFVCGSPKEIIAKLFDVVLNPAKYQIWDGNDYRKTPLNLDLTREVRAEQFMLKLADAPFDLDDATLLPISDREDGDSQGGACTTCKWNTANREGQAAARKGRHGLPKGEQRSCLNPSCFRQKVKIHAAAELVKARHEGHEILSAEESAKAITSEGDTRHNSRYVRLDEKPDWNDRNDKVDEKHLPTWEKIVTGTATATVVNKRDKKGEATEHVELSEEVKPAIVIAQTPDGRVVKLIERKAAQQIAEKVGTSQFLSLSGGGGGARSQQQNDFQAKEREEQKLKRDASFLSVTELVQQIEANGLPKGFWPWLIGVAQWHGSHDACTFTLKRRGLSAGDCDTGVRELAKKLKTEEQKRGLAVELLIGRLVKFNGVGDKHFKALCALYKVDAAKIDKKIRTDHANAKKDAAKKAKQRDKEKAAKEKKKTEGAKKPEGKKLTGIAGAIVAAIRESGAAGITIKDLCAKLKKPYRNVAVWLALEGKKVEGLKKISPGTYAFAAQKPASDDGAKAPLLERITTIKASLGMPFEVYQKFTERHGLKDKQMLGDLTHAQLQGLANDMAGWEPPKNAQDKRLFIQSGGRVLLIDRVVAGMLICADPFHEAGKHEASFAPDEWDDLTGGKADYVRSEFKRLKIEPPKDIARRCLKGSVKQFVEAMAEDATPAPAAPASAQPKEAAGADVLFEETEYQKHVRVLREQCAVGDKLTITTLQGKLKLPGRRTAESLFDALVDDGQIVEGKLTEAKK